MEITGKLIKLMPIQTGQGKNGEWKKQEFLIETDEKYPKQIALTCFNDKIDLIDRRQPGDVLTVKFDIESREYNGKYFSNINAYSVSGSVHGSPNPPAATQVDPLDSVLGPLDDDSPTPAEEPKRTVEQTNVESSDLPF